MELSIVIPVYNSANILPELVKQIELNVKGKINSYELFLVNDCSKDNSWNVIKELSSNNLFIKGLNLKKNYGQHNSIMAGLNESSGDYIILMDDDLQHPPNRIYDIYSELKKAISLTNTGGFLFFRVNPGKQHDALESQWIDFFDWNPTFILNAANQLNCEVIALSEDGGNRLYFVLKVK